MELLTAASDYRRFMERQIDLLKLQDGDRVVDLGCGTGEFSVFLAKRSHAPRVNVTAIDFIGAGLLRSRERMAAFDRTATPEVRFVKANLDLGGSAKLPLRSGVFDAALASLLVSYVNDPAELLAEVYELLRPGGRLVISAPRRDADMSKLYADMMAELPPARVRELFGIKVEAQFDAAQRQFLNEAARILTLEEAGVFTFRDESELARLVGKAGFANIETELELGEPPQTVVLTATRH
jgi:SAM-dependent methyltransferase